jgi:hypothetical protein
MPLVEERGVTKAAAKVCSCESCKKGRKEPSKIESKTIHGYASQPPGGWVKQKTYDEDVPNLFMGVELETTVTRGVDGERAQSVAIRRELERLHPYPPEPDMVYDDYGNQTRESHARYTEYRNARYEVQNARYATEARLYNDGFGLPKNRGAAILATAEETVSLAEPIGFWHPKHDGSVSGPEFASLPGSLAYWYSIRSDLDTMFTSMLHAGVRSHTGDTAGMHISMSVEAFGDSEHLVRFAKLVHRNPRWAQRMSQRTNESMSWCHLGDGVFALNQDRHLTRWAERVMMYGESGGDRYTAINASCGGGRIEFRLPRGTLRVDRFYKNLEWVASMIEFTRNYAPTDSATYMRWVMSQGARYGSLKGWLREKFGLTDGMAFVPELAETTAAAVRNESLTRPAIERCECGDGCAAGDCGQCEDREFYGQDEDDDSASCPCGFDHDMAVESYQDWTPGQIAHTHSQSGRLIGEMRHYRPDGTEYPYLRDGTPDWFALETRDPAENPPPASRRRRTTPSPPTRS